MSEVKTIPFVYWADCEDPDQSSMCWHKEDALTQINDHGGTLYELSHTRELIAAQSELAALREELATSQERSVTNIMMDVVPGLDGMGEEIYAKSAAEVQLLISNLYLKTEELGERLTAAEQRNAELAKLLENSESLLESLNCSGIMQFTRPDLATSVRNYVREAQSRRLRAALKPTELQATIAQLESKLNRAINLDFERRETIAKLTVELKDFQWGASVEAQAGDEARNEVASLSAEIERLKGGQGEPVAWAANSNLAEIADGALWSGTLWGKKNPPMLEDRSPLYASQPAPVSVVLPSADDLRYLISRAAKHADLTNGANYYTAAELAAEALVDKVKELNQ
jgi:hypothetical protein